MQDIKIEQWNDFEIRFVKRNDEWWAVLKDVCDVLGLRTDKAKSRLNKDHLSKVPLNTAGGKQEMLIVNEFGIYDTVFQSRKKEAIEFRYWIYEMVSELRKQSGLEGFEVFRMLDKEHQKEMMKSLRDSLSNPVRVDFIKANVISNKAVSTKYGFDKMIKKKDMSPDMLKDREPILEDTVKLMEVKDKFGLDIQVSNMIYERYN